MKNILCIRSCTYYVPIICKIFCILQKIIQNLINASLLKSGIYIILFKKKRKTQIYHLGYSDTSSVKLGESQTNKSYTWIKQESTITLDVIYNSRAYYSYLLLLFASIFIRQKYLKNQATRMQLKYNKNIIIVLKLKLYLYE